MTGALAYSLVMQEDRSFQSRLGSEQTPGSEPRLKGAVLLKEADLDVLRR